MIEGEVRTEGHRNGRRDSGRNGTEANWGKGSTCTQSVASELWGQGGYIVPPSSGLVPPVPPSQRCSLCQNFKQTTLTTRLYKVRTNLYPPLHLRKRSDAPALSAGNAATPANATLCIDALHVCCRVIEIRQKDGNTFHITVSAYHLSKRACGHWTRGRRAFVACSPQLSVRLAVLLCQANL